MLLLEPQERVVKEIVNCYGKEKEIQFKAPTGSGKTLMATSVIANMINNYPEKKFIFIIATISSSSLPEAFEKKINEYKEDLITSDFEVEYIKSPSNSEEKSNNKDNIKQSIYFW